MITWRTPALFLTGLATFACSSSGHGTTSADAPYPLTRTENVRDVFHGTEVPDPYRWLEDTSSPEVATWVAEQNRHTEAILSRIPARATLRARLSQIWNQPRRTPPSQEGGRWFSFRNDGLRNQSVLHVADDPEAMGRVLLDPNLLSADGTTSVLGASFSKDGSLMAYAVSERGSDWRTWRVLDTHTGANLPDTVRWSKFAGAAWLPDGSGFFYQRYPEPKEGETYQAATRFPQLCLHMLGTEQAEDIVLYERPDQPRFGFSPTISDDGRYLLIRVSEGTDRRNRVAYVDLSTFATTEPAQRVKTLLWDFDASYDFLGNDGPVFWFQTDLEAPRGRIIALDLSQPGREHWTTVVDERKETLAATTLVAGHFVSTYMRDACHVLLVHSTDGSFVREIPLPGLGTVGGLTGKPSAPMVTFSFTTFTQPATVFAHDVRTGATRTLDTPTLNFDPGRFTTRQVFYQSKDGTRIPMFLVHRTDLRQNGDNKTLLYGYGGFRIPILPSFSPSTIAWIEQGGIFASANLRGGGEYGSTWHSAGNLANKQNVFDDFIAAAEYLIRNDYTRPERLAINGRSNGGLLVGAVMTQRPDLCAVAIPEVGVLDMLRYHLFTIGWAWASDYGRADDEQMFPILHAYSPLHQVKPGTSYPATLVMTGDHDDRVVPCHSYKFTAALQAAQQGPAPILIRIDTSAGHGAGKPVAKVIDEAADRLAFLSAMLEPLD